MYHPYFRGKQFELITIRETADLLAGSGFTPIIEPVKETLNGLDKTLAAICKVDGSAIVVVNPLHGDHSDDGDGISKLLSTSYLGKTGITAGILLRDGMSPEEAMECYTKHKEHKPSFVHAGFTEPKGLVEKLGDVFPETKHIFIEDKCGKLYRKHFQGTKRILIRDGFCRRKKNADHPAVEEFSDLHITYPDEGVDGFGDFLIVGNDFIEGGGPAYAVAIHLTFIDPEKDDVMFIYHFLSTTNDTPNDPAGKFGQALEKLIEKLDSGTSKLFESSAIKEFRDLHANGHFPGLGMIKKLSMKHHIETLANYLTPN